MSNLKYLALSQEEKEKISPASPCLPEPLELPALPSFHDINTHLYLIRASLEYFIDSDDEAKVRSPHEEYTESPWLLITKPFAFTTRGQKRRWQKKNEDYGKFHCFADFHKEFLSRKAGWNKSEMQNAKPEEAARIGLFYTKENEEPAGQFQEIQTHAWIAIHAKTEEGYELWIFDSNCAEKDYFDREEIGFTDLTSPAHAFITFCETRQGAVFKRIWVNRFYGDYVEGSGTGLQRCMEFLYHMLQSNLWIQWPWTPNLSRAWGFKPVVGSSPVMNSTSLGSSVNPIIIAESPEPIPSIQTRMSPEAVSSSVSLNTQPAILQQEVQQYRENRTNLEMEPIPPHTAKKRKAKKRKFMSGQNWKEPPGNTNLSPTSTPKRKKHQSTQLLSKVSKPFQYSNSAPWKRAPF